MKLTTFEVKLCGTHSRPSPMRYVHGLVSLAVLDPKIANLGVDHLGKRTHAALAELVVAVGTLDPQARKVLQGVKVSSYLSAEWVRAGFTGLRGAAGSSELLLAMGGMYLLSDSLTKTLKDVEQAMGDKAVEARLALYGSSLGVLGGGVEVVGIALEKGAVQVKKVGGLSSQAMSAVNATARVGNVFVRAGATIGAVAGLYDATQAGFAANRAMKGGDSDASWGFIGSMIVSGFGAGTGIWAAATGASALLGPLGIAVLLGIAGYILYKWAEGEESTSLDRWARRCYFGKHDEDPPIHWNKPEHAHIAIAELNAATLGIEAGVNFRLRIVNSGSHSWGGPMGSVGAPVPEQHLEYRLLLPLFDANRSAYRWSLTVHRHGDGAVNHYTGGEVLAQGELSPPTLATAASQRQVALVSPKRPNKPDYRADSALPTQEVRTVSLVDARTLQIKDIKGAIALLPDTRRHNIEAATLSVTYWPDRDIHDAYAELTLMDSL